MSLEDLILESVLDNDAFDAAVIRIIREEQEEQEEQVASFGDEIDKLKERIVSLETDNKYLLKELSETREMGDESADLIDQLARRIYKLENTGRRGFNWFRRHNS